MEFSDKGEPIVDSPIYQLGTAIGELTLTWFNTNLETYPAAPEYNHLEVTTPDISKLSYKRLYRIRVGVPVMAELVELKYPLHVYPFVTKSIFDWLYQLEVVDLQWVEAEGLPKDFDSWLNPSNVVDYS